jgi:hypothetical protein
LKTEAFARSRDGGTTGEGTDVDKLKKILGIVETVTNSAAGAGVPIAGLVSIFAGIVGNIADQEAALTGKTRAEIFAQNKIDFAKLINDLTGDAAKDE